MYKLIKKKKKKDKNIGPPPYYHSGRALGSGQGHKPASTTFFVEMDDYDYKLIKTNPLSAGHTIQEGISMTVSI